MTENKRFTLEESLDCYNYGIQVVDIIKDNGIELPQSTACDLLNKFSEENKQLKHRLSQQEMEYATTACRQAEENEQLKSTINTLTHDNTKMKKVLNTTKNENEQIKHHIKEAYETERTALGKSVLKQLLNNIGEI